MKLLHFFKISILAILQMIVVACSSTDDPFLGIQRKESLNYDISIENARLELTGILTDINSVPTRSSFKTRTIADGFSTHLQIGTRSDETSLKVHVFNFNDSNGYAIMSADSRIPSLIALVETGQYSRSSSTSVPGVEMFYENLETLYEESVKRSNLPPKDTTMAPPGQFLEPYTEYGEWQTIVYAEGGYCPVKWGQRYPYNIYCPEYAPGQNSVAGCVPVAVAQLMACHKHPAIYNNYIFHWNNMVMLADATYAPEATQQEIARLIQQLGLSKNLDVDYGKDFFDGSGTKSGNISRTLKNFGFKSPGNSKDYSLSEVIAEIVLGYPLLMSGSAFKKEDGHQWLIHGLLQRYREIRDYDANGELISTKTERYFYPLCNWGWDGDRDGYYLNNAFDATLGPVFSDDEIQIRSSPYSQEKDTANNYKYRMKIISGIRK